MRNKRLMVILTVIGLVGFTALGVANLRAQTHKLQLKEIELQDRSAELKKLELEYTQLNKDLDAELHESNQNEAKVKQLEDEKKRLEAEKQRLERELQAKLERKEAERIASAQESVSDAISPKVSASAPSGGKYDWMRAAGIPESDWAAVDSIVQRESGWNPNAVNPSSGACGLGQQLPCGKWAGAWNDPVAALIAQKQYVEQRYGGYWGAVSFWNQNHWY